MRKKERPPVGNEVFNLQLAGELDQQLMGTQQALLVADSACFQAVDQLDKLLFFGPISGKRAILNGLVSLGINLFVYRITKVGSSWLVSASSIASAMRSMDKTRVALAALNLRKVLHRHARNARDVFIPLQDTHSPL